MAHKTVKRRCVECGSDLDLTDALDSQREPPRVDPKVRAAPKIKQVLWCDFPRDAQLPELWKKRPVVVISKTSHLYDRVTVVPMTTKSQPNNGDAVSIKSPIDGAAAWVICNHITTFAVSRLSPPGRIVPRVSEEDFNKILLYIFRCLPRPRG